MNHTVEMRELSGHITCNWEITVKEIPSNKIVYVSNYIGRVNAEKAYDALKRKYHNG